MLKIERSIGILIIIFIHRSPNRPLLNQVNGVTSLFVLWITYPLTSVNFSLSFIGFYPSIVYINQEVEVINGSIMVSHNVTNCIGVILNEYFVLTFKRCLKATSLQTVIRYGAISNNCTGCPITVAKDIIPSDEHDVSLIFLKFPIKFNRIATDLSKLNQANLSQPVGPSCELEKTKHKKFLHLTWFNLVSHGTLDSMGMYG